MFYYANRKPLEPNCSVQTLLIPEPCNWDAAQSRLNIHEYNSIVVTWYNIVCRVACDECCCPVPKRVNPTGGGGSISEGNSKSSQKVSGKSKASHARTREYTYHKYVFPHIAREYPKPRSPTRNKLIQGFTTTTIRE